MMTDWYSGAVIYKKTEDGSIFFLLQEVVSTDPRYRWQKPQIKNIGGKSRGTQDTDEIETLRREIFEETDMSLRPEARPELLFTEIKGLHQQFFFLLKFEDLEGKLRDIPKQDGSSLLSAPFWVNASRLRPPAKMGSEVVDVYRTHKRSIREALRRIS